MGPSDRAREPEFVGWDGPLLPRAAERLVAGAAGPTDLGDLLVAVPGARAGRTLLAHLSDAARRRGWAGFLPPRVLTQGRLVDELLVLESPTADRTTRTLSWERALRASGRGVLPRIVASPPADSDRSAWWRIAESLRSLHGELAPWGLDFADVLRVLGERGDAPASELRRWESLARVQAVWRERMDAIGLDDPHEARIAALREGRVQAHARVVLVGVVDMNALLRQALEQLREPPRVITFAPPEAAEGFDALGCLVPRQWADADVDLPLGRWHVVDGPDDQARAAVALIAREGGPERAGDLSLGVLDEEIAPYLKRRLGASGVRARDAAGSPFDRTAPARLLAALEDLSRTFAAEELASLVRHPDIERVLAPTLDHDPVARLDAFRQSRLPRRMRPDAPDVPADAARREDVEPLHVALDARIGPLGSGRPRPLATLCGAVRAFLERVYGNHPLLDPSAEGSGASLAAALELIGAALAALERVPAAVAGDVDPASGLALVLRTAASIGPIPDPPARDDEPVVEMLGWLELQLDDAPHLVVAGVDEGRVPASGEGDRFLPDRVRSMLGVEDEARRLARDVYTVTALLASQERVDFVSGRRTRDGDPLFPSRIAFFADDVAARVAHALQPKGFEPIERGERPAESDLPPLFPDPSPPEAFAVTSFKAYIESPLLFHLRRVRRLETVDDRALEMDPLVFGTVAHEVLERFGRGGPTTSTDPVEIEDFLGEELDRVRAELFPASVLPAVPLQLEQLRLRFASFALWQAASAAEGWRIREVEWAPAAEDDDAPRGCTRLDMGEGEDPAWIRGTIDRIEQNAETGLWRVLDYKTSHKSADPESVHRSKGAWRDLQLPLYAHMVRPLVGAGVVPALGYVNLPGDGSEVACRLVGGANGWSAADVGDALDRAREIVRAVRRGDVHDPKSLRRLAPIEEELLGVGLVREPEAPVDEEVVT
ncbi:MAG: PD-(D/E)XK nuclease family protein [Planctomycetota bacterium]